MELTIRESEFDYSKVVDLAFKRQEWGKQHTVYTCGDVTINIEMSSYDFRSKCANFYMTIIYKYDDIIKKDWTSMYIYDSAQSVFDMSTYIKKRVKRFLDDTISSVTRSEAKDVYKDLYHTSSETLEKMEKSEYKDDYQALNAIKDGDIRKDAQDLIIDKLQEELNAEYEDELDDYPLVSIPNIEKIQARLKEQLEKED